MRNGIAGRGAFFVLEKVGFPGDLLLTASKGKGLVGDRIAHKTIKQR